MITRIWINRSANKSNSLYLPELTKEINSIGVEFDTEENARQFLNKFPKSIKVKFHWLGHYENGKSWKTANVEVWISPITDVTGAANESGVKRITKFYNAVKKELKLEN